MKNVLLSANILLFVFLLMAYTKKNEPVAPSPNASVMLGIDPELSRQMLVEYREKIWRTRNINGGLGKDARSVWFSLEKLKAFIASIEQKVGTGCTKDYGLGIRIYYSVYPDSTIIKADRKQTKYFNDHKLPMEYANHHTVLMVPTYWNEMTGHNYDFDPRFRKGGRKSCEFASIQDLMPALFDNNLLGDTSKFFFSESGAVPNKKTFMIIPDNTDTRRFMPEFGYGKGSALLFGNKISNKGGADDESYFDTQSDFTNGGSLIPPPYPNLPPAGTSFMINPGANPPPADQSKGTIKQNSAPLKKKLQVKKEDIKMAGEYKIHIPSSGASYMRWVDGTIDTGWVKPTQTYKIFKSE